MNEQEKVKYRNIKLLGIMLNYVNGLRVIVLGQAWKDGKGVFVGDNQIINFLFPLLIRGANELSRVKYINI